MSYSTGEALILTQIQAATGYSTANTSRGNWLILNKEGIVTAAILRPGPFTNLTRSGARDSNWRTVVEVWRKYSTDGESLTNLEADVENILTRLNQYPHMADTGNTITQAVVSGGGDVVRIPPPPNGPHWLMQELNIEWLEQSSQTYAE